jgi:hypothetical protein
MHAMTKAALTAALLALVAAPAGFAQTIESHTVGPVTYASGGIGLDGVQAIHAMEPGYDLKMMFAKQGSGEYMADVKVSIADAKGNDLVSTMTDGPYFLAKLPRGHYRVTVEAAGKSMTRMVEIPGNHIVSQNFYWSAVK